MSGSSTVRLAQKDDIQNHGDSQVTDLQSHRDKVEPYWHGALSKYRVSKVRLQRFNAAQCVRIILLAPHL